VEALLEALAHDNLVALRKILENGSIDLSQEVVIGAEYDLDEPDEVPVLVYAISLGASIEALEMLVEAGADIAAVNREGVGILDVAIKHKRLDIVKLCEVYGVDLFQSRRKSGITPLILAASFGDMEIVKYLLERGADMQERDSFGMTAADYARRMGQKQMLTFLERQKT